MIAFLVATPLQFFNLTVIMRHYHPRQKVDLFVLNIACDMHKFIEENRLMDFINDVYYLDDVCQHYMSRWGTIYDYVFYKTSQKRLIDKTKDVEYSDYYTTWVGHVSSWLFTKLNKYHKNMEVHFYEEGLGVYLKPLYPENKSWINYMLSFLGYKQICDYVKDVLVYEPSMCFNKSNSVKYEYKPIGKLTSEDLHYLLKESDIADYNPYICKALFFENNYEGTEFEGVDENKLIDQIAAKLGKENLTIRLHPRTNPDKYASQDYVMDDHYQFSWEKITGVEPKIEDIILISTLSTAVYTPKMIYGKEPRVIILGLMVKNEFKEEPWANAFWTKAFESLCIAFKQSYSDPELVQIPANARELDAVLDSWNLN